MSDSLKRNGMSKPSLYTKEAIQERRAVSDLLRQARQALPISRATGTHNIGYRARLSQAAQGGASQVKTRWTDGDSVGCAQALDLSKDPQ